MYFRVMHTMARILPHYTYEDYRQWEGQWEIIEGIPYAMSPAPLPYHQFIAGNLHSVFWEALKGHSCGCRVYQPIDYLIEEDTVLNPDLLIVCKPIAKKFLDFPPVLVAEILSPSTALKDRHTKYALYQKEGVKYYLIIDPDEKLIEKYVLSAENEYVKQEHLSTFHLTDHCAIQVEMSAIWE